MNSDRQIHFKLNGRPVKATVSTQENLVELLRRLDLFGARESCGQGLCGCCSVIVDNVAVSGCLTLAILVDGTSVATIEGLDAHGRLNVPAREADTLFYRTCVRRGSLSRTCLWLALDAGRNLVVKGHCTFGRGI